jgi:hypothetical protein
MSTYIGDLRFTLYEPEGDSLCLQDDLECSPRFLFRAHLPKSSGETTPIHVLSLGTGNFCEYEDVFNQERESPKMRIKQHSTTFKLSTEDNLMSWTISLLLTSQLAIFHEGTD